MCSICFEEEPWDSMWEEPLPPKQVETRSYTTMCKAWRNMRDDDPPSYADWVKGVIAGRLLVRKS